VLISVLAFWLAITRAASAWQAAAGVIVLFFSRAFVDFSTSGLENPLVYLLLAAIVFGSVRLESGAVDARRGLTRLWLIGSLLYLTRPDAILLAAPLLIVLTWRFRRSAGLVGAVAVGLLPAVAWTVFAIAYYGFPFPNTAYAKLAMGISRSDLWTQGLLYLFDSIDRDPITLTTIGFAVALAALDRRAAVVALAAGLVAYLLYVVSIGGDFMAGRFLAAPLFAATLLLGTLARARQTVWSVAALALLAVGCTAPHLPLWSNSAFDDSANKPSGIIDERGVYFREHSLVRARRATFREPQWPSAKRPVPAPRVMPTCGLMGTAGLEFGPYVHFIDECALADPLLARLPAVYSPEWRAGHYRRQIPPGYPETLASGTNQLTDAGLRQFYSHLSVITRAPHLFSAARWKAIFGMNAGRDDRLIDRTYFRYGGSVASLGEFGTKRENGTPTATPGVRARTQRLAITTGGTHADHASISLDSDDRYLVSLM
jgi:arabinofuranosyltransferase